MTCDGRVRKVAQDWLVEASTDLFDRCLRHEFPRGPLAGEAGPAVVQEVEDFDVAQDGVLRLQDLHVGWGGQWGGMKGDADFRVSVFVSVPPTLRHTHSKAVPWVLSRCRGLKGDKAQPET